MDENQRWTAVLEQVLSWRRLAQSDICRVLPGANLITAVFREMEEEGLITMEFSGDEYMISITHLGRLWLEQHSN